MSRPGAGAGVRRQAACPEEVDRFEELIASYAGLIRSVVRRTVGSAVDLCAEDAEQEVRLATWRTLEEGGEISYPSSFFVKVATRVALRQVQKLRRGSAREAEEAVQPGPRAPRGDPHRSLSIRRAVAEGMATLTPRRRAAVKAWLAGMNHQEIAHVLDWTPAAARHAVYDGLGQLRSYLQERGIDLE